MRFQLVGEDAPQVRIDLSKFILTPLYMSNAEYALWSLGMANVNRLKEELNYDEFNRTRPMPSLTVKVDRKSTRLNSSHYGLSRMPSSA